MNYGLSGWQMVSWQEYMGGNALYEVMGSGKVIEGFL